LEQVEFGGLCRRHGAAGCRRRKRRHDKGAVREDGLHDKSGLENVAVMTMSSQAAKRCQPRKKTARRPCWETPDAPDRETGGADHDRKMTSTLSGLRRTPVKAVPVL
jgi:hypothetical protein